MSKSKFDLTDAVPTILVCTMGISLGLGILFLVSIGIANGVNNYNNCIKKGNTKVHCYANLMESESCYCVTEGCE